MHEPSSLGPLLAPGPKPPAKDLTAWQVLRRLGDGMIGVWPDAAYGAPIYRRRILGRDNVLVNDPALIRQVLVDQRDSYVKPLTARRMLRAVMGKGIVLAEGGAWRAQRRVLAPAFTPNRVESLLPHFIAAGEGLAAAPSGGERVNLFFLLQEAALDAACRAMFSSPVQGAGLRLAGMARAYGAGPGRLNFWDVIAKSEDDFAWRDSGRRSAGRRWFDEVDAIIAARVRRREKAEPEPARDMLDLLLDRYDEDAWLDGAVEMLRDECGTMLAAGFDTTASAMFWCAYLLAQDPAEQGRIRQEVQRFPPHRVDQLEDLDRWPRLRAALFESMRLYPPVSLIPRSATAPADLGSHHIPAGSSVMVSPWVVHRHRSLWRDAETYHPDRFLEGANEHIRRGAYIPFGLGPRTCIGSTFATAGAAIVLASLLGRHALSIVDERPVWPVAAVAITPNIAPWFQVDPVDGAPSR